MPDLIPRSDPTPAVNPDRFELSGLITRTPHLEEFDLSVAGQMVHWVARWTNTRGQHGPRSDGGEEGEWT